MNEQGPLQTVKRFLEALESGATGGALAAHLHPEVRQDEYPNQLMPKGRLDRPLPALLESAEKGRDAVRDQRFQLKSAVANGDSVAAEIEWTGTLAQSFGPLTAGKTLRARIAMFFELKDGRIYRMRNYDCYEPF